MICIWESKNIPGPSDNRAGNDPNEFSEDERRVVAIKVCWPAATPLGTCFKTQTEGDVLLPDEHS